MCAGLARKVDDGSDAHTIHGGARNVSPHFFGVNIPNSGLAFFKEKRPDSLFHEISSIKFFMETAYVA